MDIEASVKCSFNAAVPVKAYDIVNSIGRKIAEYEKYTGAKPTYIYMTQRLYDFLVGDTKKALDMFPCIETTLYGVKVKIDNNMSGCMWGVLFQQGDFAVW